MKGCRFHVAVLLIFTCMIQSVSCMRSRPPVNSVFEGEALYRGLIFRSGPVAHLVPDLWSLLGSQSLPPTDKAVDKLREGAETLAVVDKEASATLNKIADGVLSGTIPLGPPADLTSDATIDATIAAIDSEDSTFFVRFANYVQSGDPVKVERAMVEASKLTLQVLSDRIDSGDESLRIPVWYYWDIAVAIEVVAVLILALVAVFPLAQAENELLHDDVVKIITERFFVHSRTRG